MREASRTGFLDAPAALPCGPKRIRMGTDRMTLTVADAERILRDNFAPWIQDLGIVFDAVGDGQATLRVASSERLKRTGDIVCGQALMALADTAMVFAVASAAGGLVPMTTVSQNTTFLRPAGPADVSAVARVVRLGRSVVYGEITLHCGDAARPVAHATTTYMLL